MRQVYENFPDDHDVMALLVEALMMRTVRRLWNLKTGAPAPNSDVLEALQVCERSIRLADEAGIAQHPAIVHLQIPLLEMSTMPERGMRPAHLPGLYVLTAAMQHYAKGVAHATLRQFTEAERERDRFHRHVADIPAERRFLSNPTRASLAVGAALLDGELAYHQGRNDEAYGLL